MKLIAKLSRHSRESGKNAEPANLRESIRVPRGLWRHDATCRQPPSSTRKLACRNSIARRKTFGMIWHETAICKAQLFMSLRQIIYLPSATAEELSTLRTMASRCWRARLRDVLHNQLSSCHIRDPNHTRSQLGLLFAALFSEFGCAEPARLTWRDAIDSLT